MTPNYYHLRDIFRQFVRELDTVSIVHNLENNTFRIKLSDRSVFVSRTIAEQLAKRYFWRDRKDDFRSGPKGTLP